jgi:CheY-like chemotaxis protein
MFETTLNKEPFSLLLIEDDDVDAMIISRMFAGGAAGVEVDVHRACDGQEGLEKLQELTDRGVARLMVLLDINMPRMNGFEFLSAIRSNPALERTIVFVMTTSLEARDINAAYAANVAGYVEKPMGGRPTGRIQQLLREYASSVIFPTPLVTADCTSQSAQGPVQTGFYEEAPEERSRVLCVSRLPEPSVHSHRILVPSRPTVSPVTAARPAIRS